MKAYLSGSMEYAPDFGTGWREEIEAYLRGTLRHEVYNPARDIRKNLSAEEQANFRRWKTDDPPRFREVIRKIIHYDLDVLEGGVGYVVCHWDRHCRRGGGTHGELTTAFRRGIPVYMVTEEPPHEISGWILGCCDEVFGSWPELCAFLQARFSQ
ncbi:MAG TPA: hypothetical protein PKN61_13280 [Acidobacteriota bacterium]|jgi:hypothetical protein|nr:hypothetical protein [Acidobacteriota bacterium]HQO26374.1 hypothetical protein [Acidobacteriota bacterium]